MKRLLVLAVALALPLHGGELELGLQHVAVMQSGETGELDVPLGRGFAATGEWFFRESVSAQLSATFVNPEAILFPEEGPVTDVDLGTLGLDVYALSARYHLRPAARVSPYAGAGLAYVVFGNLDDQFGTALEAEFDPEVAPLIEAGLRYRFLERLMLSAGVRYMPVTATTEVLLDEHPEVALPEELALDPVTISVGVSWRF